MKVGLYLARFVGLESENIKIKMNTKGSGKIIRGKGTGVCITVKKKRNMLVNLKMANAMAKEFTIMKIANSKIGFVIIIFLLK